MDKKISQLTAATTPLTGAEEIAIVQSGVTKKATIEDVKGYKVYTALLTQSGEGGETDAVSGMDIFKGITYYININDNDGDFTQYGAPNNNVGTYFVCNQNGIVPEGAQLYYNTGAPVVTVLENTIGNIWFTYNVSGEYNANSSNLFTQNKTVVLLGTLTNNSYDKTFVTNTALSDSLCVIVVQDGGYILQDGELNNTPIEIRVYN